MQIVCSRAWYVSAQTLGVADRTHQKANGVIFDTRVLAVLDYCMGKVYVYDI